jgi:hypothetical protein
VPGPGYWDWRCLECGEPVTDPDFHPEPCGQPTATVILLAVCAIVSLLAFVVSR